MDQIKGGFFLLYVWKKTKRHDPLIFKRVEGLDILSRVQVFCLSEMTVGCHFN